MKSSEIHFKFTIDESKEQMEDKFLMEIIYSNDGKICETISFNGCSAVNLLIEIEKAVSLTKEVEEAYKNPIRIADGLLSSGETMINRIPIDLQDIITRVNQNNTTEMLRRFNDQIIFGKCCKEEK